MPLTDAELSAARARLEAARAKWAMAGPDRSPLPPPTEEHVRQCAIIERVDAEDYEGLSTADLEWALVDTVKTEFELSNDPAAREDRQLVGHLKFRRLSLAEELVRRQHR